MVEAPIPTDDSVAMLVSRLRRSGVHLFLSDESVKYKTNVPLRPTDIEMLAAKKTEIKLYLRAAAACTYLPVDRVEEPDLPSPCQEQWWNWIGRDGSLVLTLFETFDGVKYSAVYGAITALIKENDVLLSAFEEVLGTLKIRRNDINELVIEHEATQGTAQEAERIGRLFAMAPIPGFSKWLLRAKIISFGIKSHAVVLVMNHLIVDGRSMRILKNRLRSLAYNTEVRTHTSFAAKYNHYAHWHRLHAERSESALSSFWGQHISGCQIPKSPEKQKLLTWACGKKTRYSFFISRTYQDRIRELGEEFNTSPFLVYLTIYARAIFHWSGCSSFSIRSIADTRVLPCFYSTVGLFSGSDFIRVTINDGETFRNTLQRLSDEYFSIIKVRGASIYSFPIPTQHKRPHQDRIPNDGLVINYQDNSLSQLSSARTDCDATALKLERVSSSIWANRVSAVCLELTNFGDYATGFFLLHDELLSESDKIKFSEAFFAEIKLSAEIT